MSSGFAAGSVLVTGGTGALGTAVCAALLARHHILHVTYLVDHEAERFTARMGPAEGRYVLHRADVTDEQEVSNLFAAIEASSAPTLDALVHLAGSFAYAPIEETTLATFDAQVALNLRSTFLCARAAVGRLKARGRGRIVAVGAKTALSGGAGISAYAATKAGVLSLVSSLAEELRGTGISVFAVLPSLIDTAANRADASLDVSRMVAPADIAAVIATLLGDEMSIATGAHIPVYGR